MHQDRLAIKYIDNFVNLRTDKKHERLSDGAGLWLRVTSNQTKQFRFDYIRPNSKSEDFPKGKRNTISIGSYPTISLLNARKIRDRYKRLLAEGVDPVNWKKSQDRKNNLEKSGDFSFKGVIASLNVKSIIIAAGLGSRLNKYTKVLPKCMLKFGNSTLLESQIDAYRDCGISNISVIRGYKKEKINYKGLNYFENTDYENNNVLNSLFYAEEQIFGNVIVSYSDILFDANVVKRLLESDADISIVVDIDWHGYYENRKDHPAGEAEKVTFDANNKVIKIGKILTNKDEVYGEFIGMMKLSPRGSEIIKLHFNRAKEIFWDRPFQRAETFQKAYLTDLLQDMVDLGTPIHCVIIERGWKEIDTVEDYEKALIEFEDD